MNFELTDKQVKKIEKWKKKLPEIPNDACGAIGGAYTYSFTPTGLGNIEIITRFDGHKLNVTDFDNW